MKKILLALMIISMSVAVFAASVSLNRAFPSRVDPNGILTVSIVITPDAQITGFDIAEFIPKNWSIKSWDISGYSKNDAEMDFQTREFNGKTYKAYHWAFKKAFSTAATLTYTINVPVSSGSFDFASVWTYPGGFSSDTKTLTVAAAPLELPVQQPLSPVCGNNARETGEECDGTDIASQTCASKGFASGALKCTNCRFDTGSCVSAPVCGDNACDASETCSSCSSDCGACPTEPPSPTPYYLIGAAIVIVLLGMWLKFSKRSGKKK